jgi:ketosteroid isomerase-like protein
MPPEDVELVERFHDSVARGDTEGAVGCFHQEVRFDWTESISPFRDLYVGHDGIRRFLQESQEAFEGFTPQIEEVIDCGDGRLLTPTTVSGRARGGIEVEAHGAMLWTVRDGQILEGKLFQTTADALRSLQSA